MSQVTSEQPAGPADGRPGTSARSRWWIVAAAVAVACLVLLGLLVRGRAQRQSAVPPDAAAQAAAAQGAADAGEAVAAPDSVQVIADLAELPPGPIERFELVYFHRTVRCAGCMRAEARTRKTLDSYYGGYLQSGAINFLVEDVQQPSDPAIVAKYGAFGPSLYFGVTKGGVTYAYNDADIWFAAGDDAQFTQSLTSKIDSVLTLE